MSPVSEAFRRTRAPAYVIAMLMLVFPLMELCASAWPYRINNPEWRLSVVTAAAGAATAILLALLMIYVIGALFQDRPASWFVASVSAVMTTLCVIAAGSFSLDALQMRGSVTPGLEGRFNVTTGLVLAKICLAGFGALLLAMSAFRFSRDQNRTSQRVAKKPSAVIVSSSTAQVPAGPPT